MGLNAGAAAWAPTADAAPEGAAGPEILATATLSDAPPPVSYAAAAARAAKADALRAAAAAALAAPAAPREAAAAANAPLAVAAPAAAAADRADRTSDITLDVDRVSYRSELNGELNGAEGADGESSTAVDGESSGGGAAGFPRATAAHGSAAENPVTPGKRTRGEKGWDDFEILCEIGVGAFGRVVKVIERRSQQTYAMKTISKKVLRRKRIKQSEWRLERDVLVRVAAHPYIVELLCSFQTASYFFLVMQYLPGGELFMFLRARGTFSEAVAAFYAAEVILALEHLHASGVIHRDLKPENLLMDSEGHVVVTDFGLAKTFESDDERHRTLCGTDAYMAPEMVARMSYGKPVDFWSLGVLIFEMLVGRAPFAAPSTKELHRKILSEKIKFPTFVNSGAINVLKGLLERQVPRRLGAQKATMFEVGGVARLRAEPFFAGIEWQPLSRRESPAPLQPNLTAHADSERLTRKVLDDMSETAPSDSFSRCLSENSDTASTVIDFEYVRAGAFDVPGMIESPTPSQGDVSSSDHSNSNGKRRPPRSKKKKQQLENELNPQRLSVKSPMLETIPGSPCVAAMIANAAFGAARLYLLDDDDDDDTPKHAPRAKALAPPPLPSMTGPAPPPAAAGAPGGPPRALPAAAAAAKARSLAPPKRPT
ncbi:kinase-like domain-containing protein [Pelagophyceae sp. CCMP2097]|nr:kinase-like domain-containing protein [Pelagophyceae sp. CCMP2097]